MNAHPDTLGPNVRLIRSEGIRIIRGRIPAQVRRELSAAVKSQELGHLRKDGLKPEIYFHPDHAGRARDLQFTEASEAIGWIGSVLVAP